MSATVRLIVPEVAAVHEPPRDTTIVGGSFTGVTVIDTVTMLDSAPWLSRAL